MLDALQPNPDKNLTINTSRGTFKRLPIKTHLITDRDEMADIVERYAQPHLQKDDLLFISERIVAISQGRAFPIDSIKPSRVAHFLTKFVHKSPYGIGLGSPWTMQLAIMEAGLPRILMAGAVSALTKPFGIRGLFYHLVGKNINAIDGPCDYTLPPYNKYAKLGPLKPDKIAKDLADEFGVGVVIIDANDLGVRVLGKSDKKMADDFCGEVFKDNPLGQSSEQTPMAIVRKIA